MVRSQNTPEARDRESLSINRRYLSLVHLDNVKLIGLTKDKFTETPRQIMAPLTTTSTYGSKTSIISARHFRLIGYLFQFISARSILLR